VAAVLVLAMVGAATAVTVAIPRAASAQTVGDLTILSSALLATFCCLTAARRGGPAARAWWWFTIAMGDLGRGSGRLDLVRAQHRARLPLPLGR
jgi:hypothetical protein